MFYLKKRNRCKDPETKAEKIMFKRILKRYEEESSRLPSKQTSSNVSLETEIDNLICNSQLCPYSPCLFIDEELETRTHFNVENNMDHDMSSEDEFDFDEYIKTKEGDLDYYTDLNNDSEYLFMSFNEKLRDWALHNKITDQALRELLNLLKFNDVNKEMLPKDPRTLLKKDNKKIETLEVSGGQYWHFGIAEILNAIQRANIKIPNSLELTINIDGIPVCKSSGKQFWPILMKIKGVLQKPVPVGIYCGLKKPSNLDFLNDFIDDVNNSANILVKKFVVDVPAAALIKCSKGHTGYYSCGSCTIKGRLSDHSNNIVCFPGLEFDLRTDFDFRHSDEKCYNEHRTLDSPLLRIRGFDMIDGFPRDILHLGYLGLHKKILGFLINKPTLNRSGKLSYSQVTEINARILSISEVFPSDFNRKCRPINEYNYYKGTEHRSCLLYWGPVVFKNILNESNYKHYMLLHSAISLLVNENFSAYVDLAEKIIKQFVQDFAHIYGASYCSSNVHSILHLCADYKRFGVLDNFAAFEFENYLGWLVSLMKSGFKPLEQTAKRVKSLFYHELIKQKQSSFEEPQLLKLSRDGYAKIKTKYFTLESNRRDCWFLTKAPENSIVRFLYAKSPLKIYGYKLRRTKEFDDYPFNSTIWHYYQSDGAEEDGISEFNIEDVFGKMFGMPYNNSIVLALIHHTTTRV